MLEVTQYPYIITNRNILNEVPIIEGTRIPVRLIASYYQMGMNVDEILLQLPSDITMSQVFSALAYYFDHQQEIDKDRRLNEDNNYWKAYVLSHPRAKKLDKLEAALSEN